MGGEDIGRYRGRGRNSKGTGTHTVVERPKIGAADDFGRSPHRTTLPDAELVAKVQGGETQAYAELVRRYQDRIFNTCWRICGHLEDARDLTQEAFLKAFEGLAEFRGQSGFYTWVFRVAVNLALTHRRRGRHRQTYSFDAIADSAGTQAEALAERAQGQAGADPSDGPSLAERHAAVGRALQSLDDEQRAVVVLRDIEEFSYEQIGVILQIPPGTVKSRLFRARLALRQAIEPLLGDAVRSVDHPNG